MAYNEVNEESEGPAPSEPKTLRYRDPYLQEHRAEELFFEETKHSFLHPEPEGLLESIGDLFSSALQGNISGRLISTSDQLNDKSIISPAEIDEHFEDGTNFRVDKPMSWSKAKNMYQEHYNSISTSQAFDYLSSQGAGHQLLGASAYLAGFLVDPILLVLVFVFWKLKKKRQSKHGKQINQKEDIETNHINS